MKNKTTDSHSCSESLLAMRDSIELLGGKWKLQILHYLTIHIDEKNTFKKIERGVHGISAKMLSKELKELEMNKLVTRQVVHSKPVTVEYAITKYGRTTEEITKVLVKWGSEHRRKISNMG